MTIVNKDAEWVWQALIKQFEQETGLDVAAIDDKLGHILGKEFEDFDFRKFLFFVEFKGVTFEIEDTEPVAEALQETGE